MRCLKRVVERDYRAVIAQACHRHATRAASLAVVLYDVTSLHFEAFNRAQHDNKAINAMAGRAEKVASGERPLKKDRFVTFTGTSTSVNRDLVERARSLAGIEGHVTSIDPSCAATAGRGPIGLTGAGSWLGRRRVHPE